MNPEESARLKELVSKFRGAVIRTDPVMIDPSSSRMGDPGVLCILLARFLEEHGFAQCEMVAGSGKSGSWHAWLEIDGLIVDIGADQFNEIAGMRVMPEIYEAAPAGVVVAYDSPWHSSLEVYYREPATKIETAKSASEMDQIFSAIKINLT